LPDVLELAGASTDREYLQAPVVIGGDQQELWTNPASKVVPGAPTVAWRSLPQVVQAAAAHQADASEHLEATVSVDGNRHGAQEIGGWRSSPCPTAPVTIRARLPRVRNLGA